MNYDSLLVVAFGGPEKKEDVLPFLENVVQGKRVPRERLLEVAEHYYHFGGASPINDQVRALIAALDQELKQHQIELPIYWGNRNWHPYLTEAVESMIQDGRQHALALVLSPYSSYSSCRQYRENIIQAQYHGGEQSPQIDKIRQFYNHPRFIAANVACLEASLEQVPEEKREQTFVAFTAHSLPQQMADHCNYAVQLQETCRLVCDELKIAKTHWKLVYQSRSGRPTDPWLEPDVCDFLKALKTQCTENVIIMPIGFLSDHMEVLYDLDQEAQDVCQEIQLKMVRASTVGTHPLFITTLRELIEERITEDVPRQAIGYFEASADVCPEHCCLTPGHSKST